MLFCTLFAGVFLVKDTVLYLYRTVCLLAVFEIKSTFCLIINNKLIIDVDVRN